MILGCAKLMPPICKLLKENWMEWKHLIIQEIPEIPKVNNHIPVEEHWKAIFEINDAGEPKFPLIEKVVRFARSIAEANADVERLFSQVLHIITKDRNRLDTHTLKGLLRTKSYIQTIGSCLNFEIDEGMMANISASHSKYEQRLESNKSNKDSCIQKRVLEDANVTFKENKKIKKIEIKKFEIEDHEKTIRKKHEKAKLLLEQANSIMEDTQHVKILVKEKVQLEKAEKQIQKAIIKSSCQKVITKNRSSVDINNNQTDSESN